MTSVGGIGSVFSSLAGLSAGSTTYAAAPKLPASAAAGQSPLDLLSRVQDRFSSSMSTVLADAANGAFDDPAIAARSAALRKSIAGMLAAGQASAGASAIGTPAPVDGTGGANAAPDEIAPGNGTGANAAPTDVAASQRQLMELDVQQARTRLANVHASLAQRFTAGARLPSAASGQLDYHTYSPRTSADADAFAQRMAIDVTEGAAALEVTATQLQLAKADASVRPTDAAAQTTVSTLAAQYDAQQARVLDMVKFVDARTSGSISNDTPVSAPDRAMAAVTAAAAVADRGGTTDIASTVDKLSRMHTVVVEEATVPGGSKHLDHVVQTFAQAVGRYLADESRRANERRRDEQQREEQRAADDQRAEHKGEVNRQAEAHARQYLAERIALDQAAQQHGR